LGRSQIRRIRVAVIFGGLCSFWFGGSFIFWLLAQVIPWLWTWSVSHIFMQIEPPASFPAPWPFFLYPNLVLGAIWLVYYAAAYWKAPRAAYWKVPHRKRAPSVEYDYQYNIYTNVLLPKLPALSPATPGEQKHQLVERCYEEYRKALKRYDPPPIPELKTPPNFYYRSGNKLEWLHTKEGLFPILPQELLTPQSMHLLLPLLAQHLAWYNNNDFGLRSAWSSFPDRFESFLPAWVLAITGNFLWLPILCKDRRSWESWLIRQVYRADAFAVCVGQGFALEHILLYFDEERKRRGQVDCCVPTLISRLGQLEALNRQERERMRELGLTPVEPPLIKGMPPQLRPGFHSESDGTYFWL